MKKIIYMTAAMVFGLAVGLSYAGDNGVTDFTGKTYDTLEIAPAVSVAHNAFESSATGGIRLVDNETGRLHNGITDFSGRTYDALEIGPAPWSGNFVEGSATGGLRTDESELNNGVTDFTGRSYDSIEVAPVAAMNSIEAASAGGLREGPEANKASHKASGQPPLTTPSHWPRSFK